MNTKISFFIALFFGMISFQVSATGLWSDLADGFGAVFPEPPIRVGAATSDVSSYAFQSTKIFDNGGALYAITVTPTPRKSTAHPEYLEKLNAGFVQVMGQSPSRAKVRWTKFGDARKRLNYEFDFVDSGHPMKGHGFWIIDKDRVIRVSVSYTNSLASDDTREVIAFLDSFVLITDRGK